MRISGMARRARVLTLGLAVGLTASANSWAALGAAFSSAPTGAVTGSSSASRTRALAHSATASVPYTVQQTTLASGTVVREYAHPGGAVFGVAWSGPTMPSLKTLLGTYFDTFKNSLHTASGASALQRNAVSVQSGDLVVHSFGHMRAFRGQAYLPSAMPSGVTASDIQ